MKRLRSYIVAFLFLLASLTSCIDDLNRDMETIEYNPCFSIPLGPLSYTLDDIMPPISLSAFAAPDSALETDTSLIIYNDDIIFYNPQAGYDTSFIEPVNFSNLTENISYVVSLMLRTNLANKIPSSIGMQGYLQNNSGEVVDSISHEGMIWLDCPALDSEGQVVRPTEKTVDTYYDVDRIGELATVTRLVIAVFIPTYSQRNNRLRIYTWNGIDIQLGLRAELIVPLDVQ